MANPLFKGIHQIGVAVKDATGVAKLYADAFGVEVGDVVRDDTPGIGGVFAVLDIGDQHIEVMEDVSGDGPIARAIERRGEGLYCIFIEVTDMEAAMKRMRDAGIQLTDDEPMVVENAEYYGTTYSKALLAWTHPKSTFGVLIELQQFIP